MKLIKRTHYLERLLAVRDIPDIKVITGVRRSGKSKLMDAFIDLISAENDLNIIRVKLNLKKDEAFLNADAMYRHVEDSYKPGMRNYLFIDEVQLCEGFERVVNSLYEEEKFDIYLTGSNAFLLSSDLATLFGGRVCEISLYPFSFGEYLAYYPATNLQASFDSYVAEGGMSGAYLYRTPEDARRYVNGIYRTTIAKDIITKFHIENEDLLIMLGNYLMDTVGERTSVRNIANKLTSSSYKTNDKTIGSYLSYLCKSFLFYPVQRYDIKGKRYLETERKYYLADLSFRFSEIGTKRADWGHLYENIVAIELMRRGYEVYVGQIGNKEVDFVAVRNGAKTYIQVADDISRQETFEREVAPLLAIRDAFPKMIIARTRHTESQHEGVRIVDIAQWLADSQMS
ncbi:MAG: ATP-binding protein [Eggerthellaceae bacterium]|nr:ATP-binding protein [Eggerthellaceae bacterium]